MPALRMADFVSSDLRTEGGSPTLKLPTPPQEDRLVLQLHRLLWGEEPALAKSLTKAELECLQALYRQSIPVSSSAWMERAQHVANGCTKLYRALQPEGVSRSDFKRVLERVRYVDFLRAVDSWIDGESRSQPPPLAFDVRGRAHAKDAFANVLDHVRIPSYSIEVGTLTPLYLHNLGFAARTTWNDATATFLIALPNGERLAPLSSDRATMFRGLVSANRQLTNLLTKQAPVILERALEPRPVVDHGTLRVAMFCPAQGDGPYKYLHLPATLTERQLLPVVDIESLQAGRKVFQLRGKLQGDTIASIELPIGANAGKDPQIQIFLPSSRIKRGGPFVDFATKATDGIPAPLTMEVNRRVVSENYSHLRVLLAGQMSAPAQYPLHHITVHALRSDDGDPYIGLYAPGVSPLATPPMKAFIRDEKRDAWHPVDTERFWRPDTDFQQRIRTLARDVVEGSSPVSRDAWAALHRLSVQDPVKFQGLVLSDLSPHSLKTSPEVAGLRALPGWIPFVARVEDEIRERQARSVPYVALLLNLIFDRHDSSLDVALDRLQDFTFSVPANPLSAITRLAVVAPEALQQSIDELRESPTESLAKLAAGKKSVTEFVAGLPSGSARISSREDVRRFLRSTQDNFGL